MKQSEVVIGETYYTNIGAELAAVKVVALVEGSRDPWNGKVKRDQFRIHRVKAQGANPDRTMLRSAAALRKENVKFF